MPLVNLLITLVVVGVSLWLVSNYIPMDAKILSVFGVLGPLSSYRVGRESRNESSCSVATMEGSRRLRVR